MRLASGSANIAANAVDSSKIAAHPALVARHPGGSTETTAVVHYIPWTSVESKKQFTANAASTTYTAVVSGIYTLNAHVNWGNDPSGDLGVYNVYVFYGSQSLFGFQPDNAGHGASVPVSGSILLAAGDTVSVAVTRGPGTCFPSCSQRFATSDSTGDNTSYITLDWSGPLP